MITNDKIGVYHKEKSGFYIGWFIYTWNNKIPIDHNINANIKSGTEISITNEIDSTDTFDITLDTDSLTTSPNVITIPTNSIPEKNLNNYKIKIKGFPSQTTVSSHTPGQSTITLSNSAVGVLGAGQLYIYLTLRMIIIIQQMRYL